VLHYLGIFLFFSEQESFFRGRFNECPRVCRQKINRSVDDEPYMAESD
jgi:hypothetical protein